MSQTRTLAACNDSDWCIAAPRSASSRLAAWIRRKLQGAAIDKGTALYNQAGLEGRCARLAATLHGEAMQMSVMVFDFADLLEVRAIYGNHTARQATDEVVQKLCELAGRDGIAARTGPVEFTIVLPRFGREKAVTRIQRILGSPARVEVESGGEEIVLVPECSIDSGEAATTSVVELQGELRREITQCRESEKRRHHQMQRERERHTRPLDLPLMRTLAA